MGDWGRERGGDVGASTEDLEAGRCRVALAEMTDASKRALPSSRCRHGNRNPFSRANPHSSRSRHPPPVVALEHSSSLAASAARAVAVLPVTPCRHLPLLLPPPVCLSRRSQRHTCMSRARACVRYGGRGVWRAPQKRPRPLLPPPSQPPLLPGQNRLACPCQAQKRQNSSKKGRACSTRGAGGRQALPTPWPVGTAIAHAPDRSHRRLGAVLHCRTVDFLKKARC